MSSEIIIVIVLVAAAVAGVVWLEIKSRRDSREGDEGRKPLRDERQ